MMVFEELSTCWQENKEVLIRRMLIILKGKCIGKWVEMRLKSHRHADIGTVWIDIKINYELRITNYDFPSTIMILVNVEFDGILGLILEGYGKCFCFKWDAKCCVIKWDAKCCIRRKMLRLYGCGNHGGGKILALIFRMFLLRRVLE